jgi:hypothetical protein
MQKLASKQSCTQVYTYTHIHETYLYMFTHTDMNTSMNYLPVPVHCINIRLVFLSKSTCVFIHILEWCLHMASMTSFLFIRFWLRRTYFLCIIVLQNDAFMWLLDWGFYVACILDFFVSIRFSLVRIRFWLCLFTFLLSGAVCCLHVHGVHTRKYNKISCVSCVQMYICTHAQRTLYLGVSWYTQLMCLGAHAAHTLRYNKAYAFEPSNFCPSVFLPFYLSTFLLPRLSTVFYMNIDT